MIRQRHLVVIIKGAIILILGLRKLQHKCERLKLAFFINFSDK